MEQTLNEKIVSVLMDNKHWNSLGEIREYDVADTIEKLFYEEQIKLLSELSDEFQDKWLLSAMARIEIKKEELNNKLNQL